MKHNVRVTLLLALLFISAQIAGLVITDAYIDKAQTQATGETQWKELPTIAGMPVERPDLQPGTTIWYVLLAILVGTLLILLIIKLGKIFLWKIWFFLAITLCLQISLGAFIADIFALLLAIGLAFFKLIKPNVIIHNISEVFIYGGLAAIFVPILNTVYAFILLLLLSVYDMYAVWKSKHMVKLASFQAEKGIFAGLLIPYTYPKPGKKKVKIKTAVLGGGDIGLPLIFAGTLLKTDPFWHALIISGCATLSLLALLFASKKDTFYPAMPFLTVGCALGYVIVSFL